MARHRLDAIGPHVKDVLRDRLEVDTEHPICRTDDGRLALGLARDEPFRQPLPLAATTEGRRTVGRQRELRDEPAALGVQADHFEAAELDHCRATAIARICRDRVPHADHMVEAAIGHLLRRDVLPGMDG
ncbi:MAG: hypothetical protein E6Q06_03370, partial [Candidatus Moraniibacteriota bacterium]